MEKKFKDKVSDSFILSNENLSQTFHVESTDFYFYLSNVQLNINSENIDWQEFIANIEIRLHIYYNTVDLATEQTGAISFPIHLFIEPHQVQPFFKLNKLVDRHVFGNNIDVKKLENLKIKIELIEKQIINLPYTLQFEIEKVS
jgi:hypothetical protein